MGTDFPAEFAALGRELADKGVTMMILKAVNGKALIYIYRSADLEKVLMCEDVRQLLRACGYSRFDVSGALDTLKARLNDIDAFPHEIGVFLGYPLEDVKGFIENEIPRVAANSGRGRALQRMLESCQNWECYDKTFELSE